ncbi:MAG: SAM-dependent methyltransferase [Rhodospirillales bacterium]|nr:SAM-dependent methyltransferase [Rhodospirillales bacterium]
MTEALTHPDHGYYMSGDPLGRAGDFITAPEVSQMFGELIGLWCAHQWTEMGSPPDIKIVELGPGRGTLMADAVRAGTGVPGFLEAAAVHLIEASPALAKRQKRSLSTLSVAINWHPYFEDVPGGPLLVIANEFLDALPIRQFVRTDSGWSERCVDLDAEGCLIWSEIEGPAPTPLPAHAATALVGDIIEISEPRDRLAAQIAGAIRGHGGAALFVDYGHTQSAPGDTLQAVKGHRYHDVLADPGDADVTSHVDFEALGAIARAAGTAVSGPVTQGAFLTSLGIEARADQLSGGATPRQTGEVLAGLKRLIAPSEMGTLFKVLAITQTDLPLPEGFQNRGF